MIYLPIKYIRELAKTYYFFIINKNCTAKNFAYPIKSIRLIISEQVGKFETRRKNLDKSILYVQNFPI